MIPDQTIRNEYGSADMVAFLRRDAGELGVQLREWERHPAALELHRRGWEPERIAHAVGIHSGAVRDLIAGTNPRPGNASSAARNSGSAAGRSVWRSKASWCIRGRSTAPRAATATTGAAAHRAGWLIPSTTP